MATTKEACCEHEIADGCLCHAPVRAHEATPDHALPAAMGGVDGDPTPDCHRAGPAVATTERT